MTPVHDHVHNHTAADANPHILAEEVRCWTRIGFLSPALVQRLQIDGHDKLRDDQAAPCREGERRPVWRDADAANVDLDAMAGTEGNAPEATITHALDRDAGDNAQDGKEDESAQVCGD